MYHSPANNTGTSATPEPDRGTDLERQVQFLPPPNEAAEHPDHPPKGIHPPTDEGLSRSGARPRSAPWTRHRRAHQRARCLLEWHKTPPDLPAPDKKLYLVRTSSRRSEGL
jgi:hypothetical protein